MNKEFYKLKTSIIKALSNPIRLMIVDCLRDGEKSVTQLIELLDEEQSNISKSLGILKSNGLIKDRKEGLNVFYSLKICCINQFFCCLDSMIEENIKYQQELINSSTKKG
ncbi:MAG: metalloregulator ArsR/SmtB family transcription factor [bacterium]